MDVRSHIQEYRTDFVHVGDTAWEMIGDDLVIWVYGEGFRIAIAGEDLKILANMLGALGLVSPSAPIR